MGLTNDDNIYIMVTYKATRNKGNTMTTSVLDIWIMAVTLFMVVAPIVALGIQDARRHPWGK